MLDPNLEDTVVLDSAPAPSLSGVGALGTGQTAAQRLFRWATKGGLAILEQVVISGANFIMGVFLGHWLLPAQYGAYAYAFSVFILVSLIYQALILEPMAVFGPKHYRNSLRGYLRSLLCMHLGASTVTIGLLEAVCCLYTLVRGPGLPAALAGVTIASPCVLLFWLARRGFFMKFKPEIPAASSFFYAALVIGALLLLRYRRLVTPFNAFLITAFAALLASVLLLALLYWDFRDSTRPTSGLRESWRRHWVYGRWALAAAVVAWFPANIYYPVLGHFYGLSHAGQFRAIANLVQPVTQTYAALSILVLAYVAKMHGEHGNLGIFRYTRNLTLLFIGGAVLYWSLVIPLDRVIFQILYGGRYLELVPLIPWFALASVLWAAVFGPVVMLRGMEAPNRIFYAHLGSSITCMLLGIPFTWKFGLRGVAWGMAASSTVAFVLAIFLLRRHVRSTAPVEG